MTENKRFTVDNDGKYYDKFNNCYVTVDYLLDLSNSLSDENEQLKSEIEELEKENEILEGRLWNCRNAR